MIELGPQQALAQRIAELERQVQWLIRRDVLQNASIDSGGLDVNGGAINVKSGQAINVLNGGDINIEGGGSINIAGGGAAYVNGLKLSAVAAASITGWQTGYAVPTSATVVVSSTITVPTGYTTAIIFVNGEVEFANNQTFTVTAQGQLAAASSSGSISSNGPGLDIPVTAGATNTMTATLAAVISGMSTSAGQTITIDGYVACGNALSANAYNAFGLTGVAIFLA